jgi:N-acetylglucosamine kinase-like BadF-type ATPase
LEIRVRQYFLGIDVGGTKTHAIIADETGQVKGFGEAGPGNHETVGYDGLVRAMRLAIDQASSSAQIPLGWIVGAGFGVAGFDWPSEKVSTLQAIAKLGLNAQVEAVNDAVLGLLAGSPEGWGITVVSGTGCNCWGWDRTRQKIGHVTGNGISMGEFGGATELVFKAVHAVAYEWTRRGPHTALSDAFIKLVGAKNLDELMEGLNLGHYDLEAPAAPVVFQTAKDGDPVAIDLIRWVGCELGELVNAVVRQIQFEKVDFDLVMVGSMFRGGSLLTDSMREVVMSAAPGARFINLTMPPVIGAVLLGMEQARIIPNQLIRKTLASTLEKMTGPIILQQP